MKFYKDPRPNNVESYSTLIILFYFPTFPNNEITSRKYKISILFAHMLIDDKFLNLVIKDILNKII